MAGGATDNGYCSSDCTFGPVTWGITGVGGGAAASAQVDRDGASATSEVLFDDLLVERAVSLANRSSRMMALMLLLAARLSPCLMANDHRASNRSVDHRSSVW